VTRAALAAGVSVIARDCGGPTAVIYPERNAPPQLEPCPAVQP